MQKLAFSTIFMLFIVLSNGYGNKSEAEKEDSLKTYRLGEITSTALRDVRQINPSMKAEIEYHQIRKADASSAAELVRVIPAGQVQTNSRGETLLFIRGAAERQLGLFFDGVLLNVPWDNRMDLSMMPADITGKITVEQGTGTVLYGSNILGGAVNISSFERSTDGFGTSAKFQFGDANSKLFSITGDGKFGKINYITNVSFMKNDGVLLSGNAPDTMSHQNPGSRMRTNTDQKRLSVYGRVEYELSKNTTLGLSYHLIDGEKGVAPETHRPDSKTRFWRYPDWQRNLVAFNGEHVFSKRSSIKATMWYDNFYQKIDEYSDFTYTDISSNSEDFDNTVGTRVSYNLLTAEDQNLTIVYNGLFTDHTKEVTEGTDPTLSFDYSQFLHNMGAQYSMHFDLLTLVAGLGMDARITPKTGIFIEQEGSSSSDFTAMLGLQYKLDDELSVFANASRKTRFPTLREQFDDAMGKFVVNPDLMPETGILSEIGIKLNNSDYTLVAAGFANFYNDLIVQTSEDGFKKRINYASGVQKIGAELIASYYPVHGLDLTGHFTYIHTEAETTIEYSPNVIAGLIASYKFDMGFSMQAEGEFLSSQEAENPTTDMFETIDGSARINLRFAYAMVNSEYIIPEIYIRVNNILDEFYWDKLGLPAQGRIMYVGMKLVI
jgi:iron complex outermembrane recepter protein